MDSNPKYLGDGVYIQNEDFSDALILSTNSHFLHEATDRIYLEYEVAQALLEELTCRLGQRN